MKRARSRAAACVVAALIVRERQFMFWKEHTMKVGLLTGGRNWRRENQEQQSRLELLENRRLLSVLGTFELDGNAISGALGASGSTNVSHDWDQVFADNGATPPPSSGAIASSFVTDKVNSNADDIFQGGGSKDTLGI